MTDKEPLTFKRVTATVTVVDDRATSVALREVRQSKGLTIMALASATGLSVSMISLLESGQRKFSEATLKKLENALQ